MGRRIGIDLGTTNSVVAILASGGVKTIQNKEGHYSTPSVVSFKGDEVIVGTTAVNKQAIDPEATVYSVKRIMGRGMNDKEVQKMLKIVPYKIIKPIKGTDDNLCVNIEDKNNNKNKEYSPIEISAYILKKLKADAEYRLQEEVTDAVITVPAYFSEIQKYATREAGRKAGLNVLRILDEPTAAAISFGINDRESSDVEFALVFDLGGGTLDVSILGIHSGRTQTLAIDGNMWLGGDDFDLVIIDKVINGIKQDLGIDPTGSPKLMAKIKKESREAKERLTTEETTDIIVEGATEKKEPVEYITKISRDEFNSLIEHLLVECHKVINKALEKANFTEKDIHYVIMAGNSTLIPAVQKSVELRFGGPKKIMRNHDPKLCVAQGAAITAATMEEGKIVCPKCGNECMVDDTVCNNKIKKNGKEELCGFVLFSKDPVGDPPPYPFGIETADGKFEVFIEVTDFYPTDENDIEAHSFKTTIKNQRIVEIAVYGGDNLDNASSNEKQGEICAILPPNLPAGTVYKIKLGLDADMIFKVSCFLQGKSLPCIIMRGGEDKVAVVEFLRTIDFLGTLKNLIKDEEYQKMEKKIEEALDLLIKGEYEKVMEILKEVKEGGAGGDDGWKIIDYQLNNLFKYYEKEYGSLISDSNPKDLEMYQILIKYLEAECKIRSNIDKANEILKELQTHHDKVCYMHFEGQKLPSTFGLICWTDDDLFMAKLKNPEEVERQNLDIEFKNGKDLHLQRKFAVSCPILISVSQKARLISSSADTDGIICPFCDRPLKNKNLKPSPDGSIKCDNDGCKKTFHPGRNTPINSFREKNF